MVSKDIEAEALPAAPRLRPTLTPRPTPRNRYAAWIVAAVGVAVTASVTLYVKSTVEKAARQEFTARCDDIRKSIADRMDAHATILLSGAALFRASDRVTRESWRAFTQYQKVEQRLPGIQGIGFALLIPPAALPAHLEAIRAEGFPQYTVRPAGDRDVYSSIIYLEPFSDRNLRAFGYDMFAEPVRRTAMERARDTDHPALSGKVVLVQETDKAVQAGTLMYVPVYRRGMPTDSTAQRRAAIDGWVYSPYRMDDLMQGVLGTREQRGDQHVYLSIFDGAQPSPQNLLHTSAPAGNEIPAAGVRFSRQLTMDFNGQPWTVCCTQAAAGAFTAAYAQVWFATVASTLVAVLLFSLVRVLENTGVVAQRRAEELTGGLRESEKRNRTILQTALDGFFQADTQGRLLAVNDSYCRMSGYSEAELLGMHISDLAVTATVSGVAARIAKVMAQGEDRFEFRQRRKDGTVYDVEISGQFQPDAGGGLLVAFLHDITQRKQAEETLRQVHQRLSLAARAGGVGIWDYDVVSNRLVWDDQMFRLYGITREQFSGAYEAWQQGLHPDDRQRGDAETRQALEGERDFDTSFRVLWPDGSTHHIRGFASVERDVSGQPLRMVGTNWDVTATTRAEEALRESETNFRTFFETITDMIVAGTPDGRLLYCNPAVSRTLGYTADELLGMPLVDLYPSGRRGEAEEVFAAMVRGERDSCPLPMMTRDGVLVPVETRVWFGTWNGTECIFGVSKDLTAEQEAKQLFERLFRSNPALVALSALPERRFVDVNDTFLTTLGYAREEIIGKTVTELGLFVRPEVDLAAASALQATGRSADQEMQVRRRDGVVLDGLFSREVISSQGTQYLLTVMVDITQRKRTESELARLSVIQAELMRLATKFVNVPVERQDTAIQQSLASLGRLIRADRAYLCTYDFAKGVVSTTHEWCAQGVPGMIDDMQSVPSARLADWVALHQRGETVHIPSAATLPAGSPLRQLLERQGIRSLITLPLLLEGACLGFVGFDAVEEERVWPEADVSLLRILARLYAHFEARRAAERETLELQERLAQARDAAQEASQAKGLFLANMSHEIRTPLNAILGYAQLMERGCRSCPQEPRLHAITRSGEHLLELITNLLELVRSDTRAIALTPSEFDFPQVLEDVRLMFAAQTANQGLTLAVSCTPEVPRFIHADQGRIRQVLANLVGNALKFTTKGSVCLAASVQAGGTPEAVTLAVEVNDTGCGICGDELERIFDVFYVAESGRKAGKGTGLGLPLSRRHARGLGGDVTVTSRLGDGSSFRFTFSALIASAAGAKQRQDRTVLRLAPGQRACRILVVDDDFTNRDVLVAMLEPVGFTVEAAASALEALERLRQSPPVGLVLLDKLMPGMDGYTAIGHIRGLPGGSDIRIVVVTAVGFAAERALALAAGADGYIAKPVRRQTLMAEIARVTDLRYDYDDEEPGVISAVSAPAILTPEALARLPVAQRQALEEALRRGDIQQLRDLVGTVAHTDAGLAAGIRPPVDAYDYDRLQRLLQAAKGEAL